MSDATLKHAIVMLVLIARLPLMDAGAWDCSKVALLKTAKTGSTTLANILFRTAVVLDKKVYSPGPPNFALDYKSPPANATFDYVISHVTGACLPSGELPRLVEFYERTLGTKNFLLVTTVRNAVARYISHLKFFTIPDLFKVSGHHFPIEDLVNRRIMPNILSCMFGIYTWQDMRAFVASPLFQRFYFIPVERFEQGVAVLQQRCGWAMLHSAHVTVNENHGNRGELNSPQVPPFSLTMPLAVKIQELNSLDDVFFNAATEKFDQLWRAHAAHVDVRSLKACNNLIKAACQNDSQMENYDKASPHCTWYKLYDLDFFGAIDLRTGHIAMSYLLGGHKLSVLMEAGSRVCRQ
jgi:hypothetical protein